MDFGLTMSTHGLLRRDERDFYLQKLDPENMRALDLAELAERLGYHSVWFSDHVVMGRTEATFHTANESGTRAYPQRPNMLDAVVVMGAVAARTTRLRMASSVHIAPYRHPLSSAHQFATVDVVSGGRLIVGVGSGWDPEEFAAVGADFEHRGAIAEESVEIYRKAWTQPWVKHRGRFFTIENVSMDPKPVQKPHPPIVYGAVTEAGARRAARCANGIYPMFLDANGDPSRYDGLREAVLREAERAGRDLTGFRLYAFASGLVVDAADPLALREPRPTLTGTAEQVIEDLGRFAAHGYGHVTMHFDVRSGTIGELFELVERFADEVLPAARELEAAPLD
jgi:probable F420-dependent oxidoreductase